MKNAFTLFLLLFLVKTGYSQHQSSHDVKKLAQDTSRVWKKDSLLTKENFKAKPRGNAGGLTTSAIFFHTAANDPSIFFVETIFIKSKSFLIENAPYVLKHEQLHFDITELYARKLRQAIQQTDYKKVKNIVDQIRRLYDKFSMDSFKEQEKYDRDTEHGLNAAKQQVWSDDIAAQLTALDAYSSPEIDIVR